MKKIIDGKTYNTETAIKIGEWSNYLGCGDFRACEEALYKSKLGQYFLYGSGGALTRWSRSCGNTTWGISDIVLMDESEAREWAEQRLDADEFIEEFGEIEG